MHYPPHKHMFENPCPFSRCVISKHMFLEYSTVLIYYTCKRTFRSINDRKRKLFSSKENIIELLINIRHTSKYTILKYDFMWVWPLYIHTITIWIKHIQALDKILAWAITQEDKELWSLIFSFDYRTRDLASYPSHTDSLWV